MDNYNHALSHIVNMIGEIYPDYAYSEIKKDARAALDKMLAELRKLYHDAENGGDDNGAEDN